jgi:hypothetical protein
MMFQILGSFHHSLGGGGCEREFVGPARCDTDWGLSECLNVSNSLSLSGEVSVRIVAHGSIFQPSRGCLVRDILFRRSESLFQVCRHRLYRIYPSH